ncbi:MAG: LarC family nickel insertion protein [Lachnospiraceae bacterium]|nr:LarC family nickel insertion protein [Lachnospiraceae bacterium]
MGKTLYLECEMGLSGDMFVATLLDLGAREDVLLKALESLNVDGFKIAIKHVKKSEISMLDFDVILDEAHQNHDHDMDYLYGHEHSHEHNHEHNHEHTHEHEHSHEHTHEHEHSHEHMHSHEHSHEHSHHHRGLKEIYEIIDSGNLTENANKLAKRIFEILAEAESKAHGISKEEVHFHEVGAIDSIVDVIAAAVCFDDLGYTDVVIPYLNEGRGTVRCQHGILPVPVPAVTNIVANHGLNLSITSINGELVTPTGAAIAAAIMTTDTLPEKFKIRKVGYGAGKREYERPGFVRGMEIE